MLCLDYRIRISCWGMSRPLVTFFEEVQKTFYLSSSLSGSLLTNRSKSEFSWQFFPFYRLANNEFIIHLVFIFHFHFFTKNRGELFILHSNYSCSVVSNTKCYFFPYLKFIEEYLKNEECISNEKFLGRRRFLVLHTQLFKLAPSFLTNGKEKWRALCYQSQFTRFISNYQ